MRRGKIVARMLADIPDDGTWLRRLRRWNVRHGFVVTIGAWAAMTVAGIWAIVR